MLIVFIIFFLKKNPSRNTNSVSNSLDPDQNRLYVGPDLGPNCLKGYHQKILLYTELKEKFKTFYCLQNHDYFTCSFIYEQVHNKTNYLV